MSSTGVRLTSGFAVLPTTSSEASSVSLNHVLELLVAAQREILDTQRDLIRSDLDAGRGSMRPPSSEEELALIQRYQENSLGLLKAAAEGLVQVIMLWSPSLDSTNINVIEGLPLLHRSDVNTKAGNIEKQQLNIRHLSKGASASSSLLVATLAEVEDLQSNAKRSNSQRQLYQMMFHWLLYRYRRVSRRLNEVERASEVQNTGIERLSDAIKLRSVLLVERVHRAQHKMADELHVCSHRTMRVHFFTAWMQATLERRRHKQLVVDIETRYMAHRQRETLFQTFSIWHRGKLCKRVQEQQHEIEELHLARHDERIESSNRYDRDCNELQREVDRLTHALAMSSERVTSLEDELQRSHKEIEELTAHLDVSCGTSSISLKAHRLKIEELEKVFSERIANAEQRAEEVTRRLERDAIATHRWIRNDVIAPVSAYLDASLHNTETLMTLQLSSLVDALRQPPPAVVVHEHVASNPLQLESDDDDGGDKVSTSSTVASYTSSSGDSVDRGELLLKLSHLTQEVESLRAEKLRVAAATAYSIPPSLLLHSPLMQSASFEHTTTGVEPDPSSEKLKRARRRLASLLHAKNKTVLACVCIRKWMSFAHRRKEKGKLDALEQAHRHWAQVNVEERDRALLALDERVDDDHRSIQAAMNESRVSVGRSMHLEASPSPLRGTFMSNLSFEGTYGDPAPSSTSPMYGVRRWPQGYRAPSPRPHVLDPPRDDDLQPQSLTMVEQETQTEFPIMVPVPPDQAPTLIELENEELHVALSTSHSRENSLMAQLENALRDVEIARVTISELQHQVTDQDERLLVTYIHLCTNDIVHAESDERLSLEYNELRLRLHALQSLYPQLLLSATQSNDHALTEWTRCDSRNHRNACLASDALSHGVSHVLMREYWDCWQRFTMVRRFESLLEMERRQLTSSSNARDAANQKWMHETIVEKTNSLKDLLEDRHRQEVSSLKLEIHHANLRLADIIEQSEIRVVQSKQIIRQLRNDAATGSLIASRLGGELVEYCASSAFHQWAGVIYRKRNEKLKQHNQESAKWLMNLSGKQNIANARVTEDVIRVTFAKWALLSTSTKEIVDETQRHYNWEVRQLVSDIKSRDDLNEELQQRVASMHLEITEVLKPRVKELEQQLADHDANSKELLRQELENLTEALQSGFRYEASHSELRHQQYCDELRESEALSTQELLEMQRTAHAEELRQVSLSHASLIEHRAKDYATNAAETLIAAYCTIQEYVVSFVIALADEAHAVARDFDAMNKRMDTWRRTSDARTSATISSEEHLFSTLNELLNSATTDFSNLLHEIAATSSRVEKNHATTMKHARAKEALLWDIMEDRETLMRGCWFSFHEELQGVRNALFASVFNEFDELVQYGRFLEETASSLEHRLEAQGAASSKELREHLTRVHDLEAHATGVAANARIALAIREEEINREHRKDLQGLNDELHEMRSRYLLATQRFEELSRASLASTEALEERFRKLLNSVAEEHSVELASARRLHGEALDEVEKRCLRRLAQNKDDLELEMKTSTKHQLRLQQDQSNLEFARYRNEVAETLQRLSSATQSLEVQCRNTIENLEVSHRSDLDHLRSECSIRIREEVNLELEKRLEEVTSAQQRSLTAHQQTVSRTIIDRQLEHDREIELLHTAHSESVATWERLVEEERKQHARENDRLEQLVAKGVLELAECEKRLCDITVQHLEDTKRKESHFVTNTITACIAAEVHERHMIEGCFYSTHVSTIQAFRSQGEQFAMLAAQENTMAESKLAELTSQLVRESALAVTELQEEMYRKSRQTKLTSAMTSLHLIRTNAAHHHAHQSFGAWRLWTMIEGFRKDYASLRTSFENSSLENSHLRHLIARALEERRAPLETHSPLTVISPLSEAHSANRISPSPTSIAEQMIGFSSHVNSSIERSDTTVAAVSAIVAQVDELIDKGKRMRATRTDAKTESF
ncbi:Hypothetical protein, putative [Bodo saltans]|uniref:Uncharacterized protein n=1 Tax=Bodo saltans TaxID=75058 RepID=A0A0S4JRJ6_BODSA|nr:Hypothetical protein, putative [Bodo saltans]|eukprot:CUG92874.1 Hypothetical protein, putative [Bodo saltans]